MFFKRLGITDHLQGMTCKRPYFNKLEIKAILIDIEISLDFKVQVKLLLHISLRTTYHNNWYP